MYLKYLFLQTEDVLVPDSVDGPPCDSEDIKQDIPVEPKIKESDSFDELTREDIISKDAEITRLQEFSHSSSESSLNTEKEKATTDNKENDTETEKTKNNEQSVTAPTISIPAIVIASQDLPIGDNSLPATQPKRPTPPKIPPQSSENNDTSTTETSIMQDSVSEVKNNKKLPPQIPPQPVAPPRKKRQQKKVWYAVILNCIEID